MAHEYSKFKNKNIPYAKVGRRVFNSLFDAETFCTEHGLDVNSANAEGYHDPTAYHGTKNIIRDEDEQQKRVNTLIFVLKYITRLAGFELLNRIEIKDRKTGREYR